MSDVLTAERLRVLDNLTFEGDLNTPDATIRAHVAHSLRLGHPQVGPVPPQPERVCLVGGGPSLLSTLDTLYQRLAEGALLVTVNGAYAWCIAQRLIPTAQIVMDARPSNARFVDPALPRCKYLIASQCAPATWAAVAGRPYVYVWHAVAPDNPTLAPVLDAFYGARRWQPTPGGTTVAMRALALLSLCGYLRFDLFGMDSCYVDGRGHAYAQAENADDEAHEFTLSLPGHPETARTFLCADWHAKQLEDFLQLIRLHGHRFSLTVQGDGLLAYALRLAQRGHVATRWSQPPPRSITEGEADDGCRRLDGLQRSEEVHRQRDTPPRHGEADHAAHVGE